MTKRKIKLKMIAAVILLLLFGVLIYAVRNVDVQPIGPKNSEIGFATLNKAVNDLFGTHLIWYNITDWLGVAAINCFWLCLSWTLPAHQPQKSEKG